MSKDHRDRVDVKDITLVEVGDPGAVFPVPGTEELRAFDPGVLGDLPPDVEGSRARMEALWADLRATSADKTKQEPALYEKMKDLLKVRGYDCFPSSMSRVVLTAF
jgi:hypothetical protein